MAKRNWTEEQLGAIRTTDRTMLLSAAAGSGKTAVLTQRLIECVTREKNPLDLSRVLACTFTRAAAREMRDRIGAALSQAVMERPTDPYLKQQLLLLPMAQFSTIDSFCISLLRRYGAEAGVPLGFRLSDEQESDLLRLEVMEEIFEMGYSGDLSGVSRQAFCRLISHFADLKGESPFLGVSKKVETASGMGFAVVFVMACASAITWAVQQLLVLFGIEYLQTIAFILVIAVLVQFVEMFLQKSVPSLYSSLGIYLPLTEQEKQQP